MADALQVELVAADRIVWSGQASMVLARTVSGEIGVLRGHTPLLSLLADSTVEITTEGETVVAAVDGGFISVANDHVSVLSERAMLADEIDVAEARREADEARGAADDDVEAHKRLARAEARIRAVERAG